MNHELNEETIRIKPSHKSVVMATISDSKLIGKVVVEPADKMVEKY